MRKLNISILRGAIYHLLVLLSIIVFLSGCSKPSGLYQHPYGVMIGDSIANYVCSAKNPEGKRYIEEKFNFTWINNGHNSEGSWDTRSRWQSEVIDLKPELVILNIGTKDCNVFYGYDIEDTKANFVYMAEICSNNNIVLYVNNIAPADMYTTLTNERIVSFNAWLEIEMPKYGAIVIDVFTFAEGDNPFTLKPEYYDDGIHPNNSGCEAMVEYIYNKVYR